MKRSEGGRGIMTKLDASTSMYTQSTKFSYQPKFFHKHVHRQKMRAVITTQMPISLDWSPRSPRYPGQSS